MTASHPRPSPRDLRRDLRRDAFLSQFPAQVRADVLNLFLRTLRGSGGDLAPEALAERVRGSTRTHLAGGYPHRKLVEIMGAEPEVALAFADWCRDWNDIPQGDRDRLRAEYAATLRPARAPASPEVITLATRRSSHERR